MLEVVLLLVGFKSVRDRLEFVRLIGNSFQLCYNLLVIILIGTCAGTKVGLGRDIGKFRLAPIIYLEGHKGLPAPRCKP